MFTVARLGIGGRLRQSSMNTNCIESMISICRTNHGPVKRWRDGEMKKRWIATATPANYDQAAALTKIGITTELQQEAGRPACEGHEGPGHSARSKGLEPLTF